MIALKAYEKLEAFLKLRAGKGWENTTIVPADVIRFPRRSMHIGKHETTGEGLMPLSSGPCHQGGYGLIWYSYCFTLG